MLATVICRLDYLTPKIEAAKPVQKRPNWLPVEYIVKLKIAVIVHRCVHRTTQSYLQSMLTQYVPKRHLLSSTLSAISLEVLRVNQTKVGNRKFSVAGPLLWNAISSSIWEIM